MLGDDSTKLINNSFLKHLRKKYNILFYCIWKFYRSKNDEKWSVGSVFETPLYKILQDSYIQIFFLTYGYYFKRFTNHFIQKRLKLFEKTNQLHYRKFAEIKPSLHVRLSNCCKNESVESEAPELYRKKKLKS